MKASDDAYFAKLFACAEIRLDASDEAKHAGSHDFGRIAHGCARGVLRIEHATQLPVLVRLARQHALHLTTRGAGLSQSGQAIARDGFVVDLSALNHVAPANLAAHTVRCGPGASWRSVLARVAPAGLAPKVMPLNLDVTVAGALSAGGLGSTSHRHGLAVSNVASLEVVLGTAEVVRCSAYERRDVFDSVLGGLGRAGMISEVELSLTPAAPKLRTFYLRYEQLDTLLADQQKLACEPRTVHLEGFCTAAVHGLYRAPSGRRQPLRRWQYGLHVAVGHADDDAPACDEILNDLRHDELLLVEDDELVAHAARFDPRFEAMRVTGAWDQCHPWLEAFVPASAAAQLIQCAQELPAFLGDGHRVIPIAARDRPLSVALPEGPVVVLAILPMGIPHGLREPALHALQALDTRIRDMGGKRYLSGWLFDLASEDRWAAHYGHAHERLRALARTHDPDSILESCLTGL